MKKLEREDVTCTELLEASECLTSHQDNIRKDVAFELCESICRKINAGKHRVLRWADGLEEIGALSPESVTRAQYAYALFSYLQSHRKHVDVDVTPDTGEARQMQQVATVQQDVQNWNHSFNELLATNLEQAPSPFHSNFCHS